MSSNFSTWLHVSPIVRCINPCTLQEYTQDEDRDLSLANQLGLLMSYHLQAIQHIDQLLEYSNKGMMLSSVAVLRWSGDVIAPPVFGFVPLV